MNRITEGWALFRPAQGSYKETYLYNRNGNPYKRRHDAVRELKRYSRYYERMELHHVSMFYEKYEKDNGEI